MTQIKYITNVSILVATMISISACGAKRFNSDQASSVGETGTLTPNPGEGGTGDGGTTDPGSFLNTDQVFFIYDIWGLNSKSTLNNFAYTTDAEAKQIAAASAGAIYGDPRAFSYSLYHLTPAQTVALVKQVTGVANVTADTVAAMDPGAFKQAVLQSGAPAFAHVVGLYDEYMQ